MISYLEYCTIHVQFVIYVLVYLYQIIQPRTKVAATNEIYNPLRMNQLIYIIKNHKDNLSESQNILISLICS